MSSLRRVVGLSVMIVTSPVLFASTGVNQEKLLSLVAAGFSAEAIVQVVSDEGLAFALDSDAMLHLRQRGVSQDLLESLRSIARALDRGGAGAKAPSPNTIVSEAHAAYSRGRYEDAAGLLEKQLASDGGDVRARGMLALTHLRMGQRGLVEGQLLKLKQQEGEAAQLVVSKVQRALAALDGMEEQKERVRKAVSRQSADAAIEEIRKLAIDPRQRTVLEYSVRLLQADFESARSLLNEISDDSSADRRLRQTLARRLEDEKEAWQWFDKEVTNHLWGGVTNSTFPDWYAPGCTGSGAPCQYPPERMDSYFKTVRDGLQRWPLNPTVQDLTFHALMLSGDPETMNSYGRAVLNARGAIRIPFNSKSKFFYLVIDAVGRRVYIEVDTRHRFSVLINNPMFGPYEWKPSSQNRDTYQLEMVAFDIPFKELRKIEQKAKRGFNCNCLEVKAVAFKVNGRGLAPNYALMAPLHLYYGEEAQKRATRSLAEFVITVSGSQQIEKLLEDPAKLTRDWRPGVSAAFMVLSLGASTFVASEAARTGNVALAQEAQSNIAALQQSMQSNVSSTSPAELSATPRFDQWIEDALTAGSTAYEDVEIALSSL